MEINSFFKIKYLSFYSGDAGSKAICEWETRAVQGCWAKLVVNNLDAVVAVIMFLLALPCLVLSLHWVFLSPFINQCRHAAALVILLQPQAASSLITLTGCWKSSMVRCLPPLYLSSYHCPHFKWTCVQPGWRSEFIRAERSGRDIGQGDQFSLKGCCCCIWPSYCNVIPLQM